MKTPPLNGHDACITERKRAEASLQQLTEGLEIRVTERTEELTRSQQRLYIAEIDQGRVEEFTERAIYGTMPLRFGPCSIGEWMTGMGGTSVIDSNTG